MVCMQSIKEHNLKANHNARCIISSIYCSVCNLSKNTIWKQITTTPFNNQSPFILYAIYQRTQSESKSQLSSEVIACPSSVCNLSKNTIWKQITTIANWGLAKNRLYAIYQRTQSESKSQPNPSSVSQNSICMQSIKEHNLKANHNPSLHLIWKTESVCNLSKNTIWKQITTSSTSCSA